MIRLEEKYEEALQFRKRGFTYSEIAKIVGVSKSTVSLWFSKKAFSKKVRDDNARKAARDNVKRIGLLNKARAGERKTRYADALRSAETEFKHYRKDALFMAGLMAYVSLGDMKHPSRMRLTSSKVLPHRAFVIFAQTYLGVSKKDVRFWLILPSLTTEKKDLAFWSKKLSLPLSSFYPSQMIGSAKKATQLQHGTGNTIIGNTVLKLRLLRWIELLAKELS